MAKMNWDYIMSQIDVRFLVDFFEQLPEDRVARLDDTVGSADQWTARIQRGAWRIEEKSGGGMFRLADHTGKRCVYGQETTLYIAIKKYIMKKKRESAGRNGKLALVLAGGGAKGAYQIGVWDALRRLGVSKYIEGISGTSIGAVNTLLIAKGDYDYAEAAWNRLSKSEFRKQNRERLKKINRESYAFAPVWPMVKEMFASQAELRNELFQAVGGGQAERITQKFRVFSTAIEVAKDGSLQPFPTYLPWDGLSGFEIVNVILASSAVPFVYDSVEIKGKKYYDGGIPGAPGRDNVPVTPLYRSGYRDFIVVHLKQGGSEVDKVRKQLAEYQDCRAVHIVPGRGFQDDMGAMFKLTPEVTKKNICMGREDAMSLRGKLTDLLSV